MPRPAPNVAYDFVDDTLPEPDNPFTAVIRELAATSTVASGSTVATVAKSFTVPTDPNSDKGEPVKQATIANQLSKAGEIVGVRVRRIWKDYPAKVIIWVEPLDSEEDTADEA